MRSIHEVVAELCDVIESTSLFDRARAAEQRSSIPSSNDVSELQTFESRMLYRLVVEARALLKDR